MTPVLAIELLIMAVLLICSAFFSASETTIFSLGPVHVHRMRKTHPLAADLVEKILAAPTQLLSTILIGNTLVNIAASALGYVVAEQLYPHRGAAISIPVMTLALLLFCEVTPKRLAMSRAPALAVLFVPVLTVLIWLLAPLRWGLEQVAALFARDIHAPKRTLTEDEFQTVIEVGEEAGVLDEQERTMVDGIISLGKTQASAVMTPRVDLVAIDLDAPPETREKIARGVQFRYLPVYHKSIDHPEGFLDVPRFLLSPTRDFEGARVPPHFVPETALLAGLFTTFHKENRHAAFVMDEYGGVAGMVTMGDLLEEVVGDVEKEFGPEKLTIQKMAENQWIVDGSVSIDDINYELDLALSAEGADRIAGWIGAQTSHIPRTGDVVEAQGCRVTVHRTKKNRVVTVFIEKLVPVASEVEPEKLGDLT